MVPERVREGDALLVEGDAGDRSTCWPRGGWRCSGAWPPRPACGSRRCCPVALVGTGAFLLGTPRNASCVAAARRLGLRPVARRVRIASAARPGACCARRCYARCGRSSARSAPQARQRRAQPAGRGPSRSLGSIARSTSSSAPRAARSPTRAALALGAVSLATLPFRDEVEPSRRRQAPRCWSTSARRSSATTRRSRRPTARGASPTPTTPPRAGALTFIEDFIRDAGAAALRQHPHRELAAPAGRPPRLREDARQIIREAVGGADDDRGDLLRLGRDRRDQQADRHPRTPLPSDLDAALRAATSTSPPRERPVVFIGPYEHHSNELPWRESIADVVVDRRGRRRPHRPRAPGASELVRYARPPAARSASFSAASNVTGILVRHRRGSPTLLHRHGALSFWDYAAAGPYVRDRDEPRRRRADGHLAYKDAVFLSPHKFVGGPGRPGVLVVTPRAGRATAVPDAPGGGTVAYVDAAEHRYLDDPAHREEGGTPAIVESIRAGLVFQLKDAVGTDAIRATRASASSSAPSPPGSRTRDLELLGNPDARAAVDRLVRGPLAAGPLPAPQLRRRAAQRPVRHPGPRRLLVRRPVRAPAARHRPRALARVRRARSTAAARASSRAGRGSTSTTSSPTPSSTTSSPPSTWSPDHGHVAAPRLPARSGVGAVAPRRSRPARPCASGSPLHVGQARVPGARTAPAREALGGQLAAARGIFEQARRRTRSTTGPACNRARVLRAAALVRRCRRRSRTTCAGRDCKPHPF